MLEFRCSNCSQRLVVREDRAGRVSRCPRCKAEVTIPQASTPEPVVEIEDDELTLITPAKPLDGAMLNLPDERELRERVAERQREEERLLTSLGVRRGDSLTGERRFAWPVDVLLYPTSGPGVTVLVLFVGAHLLSELVRRFVPLVGRAGCVLVAVSFIFGLCAAWYLAECIHDSARGGTRAPEFVGAGQSEMWSRVSYLLAVCIIYFVPFVLYTMFAPGRDAIFWGLAAYTLVFFPIGLLAMVGQRDRVKLAGRVVADRRRRDRAGGKRDRARPLGSDRRSGPGPYLGAARAGPLDRPHLPSPAVARRVVDAATGPHPIGRDRD